MFPLAACLTPPKLSYGYRQLELAAPLIAPRPAGDNANNSGRLGDFSKNGRHKQ
jgi:hypothetical protein